MPRQWGGGGSRFNWVSPGAVAVESFTESLDAAMKDRELKARQARADAMEAARIERDITEQTQRMEMARTNAAAQKVEREDQDTIRNMQIAALERTRDLGNLRRGDTMTPAMVEKYKQDALQGPPTQGALQRYEGDVPIYDVTQQATFKGTPQERENAAKREGYARVLAQNPEIAQSPGMRYAMQIAEETGDFSLVDDALKNVGKPATPDSRSLEVQAIDAFNRGDMETYNKLKQVRREIAPLDDRPRAEVTFNVPGLGQFTRQPGTNIATPVTDAQGNPLVGAMSAQVPPEWRNPIDRALGNVTGAAKQNQRRAHMQRLWDEGNTKELADVIRQSAVESENVEAKNAILARTTLRAQLDNAETILTKMQAQGVPTGWLTGTVEDLLKKIGTTQNPELRRLGAQLDIARMEYRKSMTGVAFSEKEDEGYRRLMPSYGNEFDVNIASIDGLSRALEVQDRNYWNHKLGENGADFIFRELPSYGRTPSPGAPPPAAPPAAPGGGPAAPPRGVTPPPGAVNPVTGKPMANPLGLD